MLFCSTGSDSWSRRKEDITLQYAGEAVVAVQLCKKCRPQRPAHHLALGRPQGPQRQDCIGFKQFLDVCMRICTTHPLHCFYHEALLFVCTDLQDFVAQPLWSGTPPQADAALASELPRAEPPPLSSSKPSCGASDSPANSNIDQTPMASPEANPAGGSEDSFQDSLEADLQWPDVHQQIRYVSSCSHLTGHSCSCTSAWFFGTVCDGH